MSIFSIERLFQLSSIVIRNETSDIWSISAGMVNPVDLFAEKLR